MSNLRNGNFTRLNSRNGDVALSISRNVARQYYFSRLMSHVTLIAPLKAHVTVLILGVKSHYIACIVHTTTGFQAGSYNSYRYTARYTMSMHGWTVLRTSCPLDSNSNSQTAAHSTAGAA